MKNSSKLVVALLALMVFAGGAGPEKGRPVKSEKCTVTDPGTGVVLAAEPDQIDVIANILGHPVIAVYYSDSRVIVVGGIVDCEYCLCWPTESF